MAGLRAAVAGLDVYCDGCGVNVHENLRQWGIPALSCWAGVDPGSRPVPHDSIHGLPLNP